MTNPYRSPEGLTGGEGGHVGPLAARRARDARRARPAVSPTGRGSSRWRSRSSSTAAVLSTACWSTTAIVARKTSWWRITPAAGVHAARPDAEVVTGLVEIRVWPWLALRGFRVTIADRVVYAEGRLATSRQSDGTQRRPTLTLRPCSVSSPCCA